MFYVFVLLSVKKGLKLKGYTSRTIYFHKENTLEKEDHFIHAVASQ